MNMSPGRGTPRAVLSNISCASPKKCFGRTSPATCAVARKPLRHNVSPRVDTRRGRLIVLPAVPSGRRDRKDPKGTEDHAGVFRGFGFEGTGRTAEPTGFAGHRSRSGPLVGGCEALRR